MKGRPTYPEAKHTPARHCTVYVVILKTGGGKYWLMAANLGEPGKIRFCLRGWNTLQQGLDYFENSWRDNHQRGFEASMSACINYIQLQPSIVGFVDMKELETKLLPVVSDEPTEVTVKQATLASESYRQRGLVFHLTTITGSYHAVALIDEVAKPFWEEGDKPQLI